MHLPLKFWRRTATYGQTATRTRCAFWMPHGSVTCHIRVTRLPSDCISAGQRDRAGEPTHRPDSVEDEPSPTRPEQPSICARRCRRADATYPQTQTGRLSDAVAGTWCLRSLRAGARKTSWSCSTWGLPSRPGHPRRWWSLTPPFHPYPLSNAYAEAAGGLSLWHCPASYLGWALPTTLPCGVRTFLSQQYGVRRAALPRLPGRLARVRQSIADGRHPWGV